MKLFGVLFISFIGLSCSADSSKPLSHYSELGCKFVYSKSDPDEVERCDCPFMKTNPPENKCLYKGKEYEIGQSIDSNVNDHECSVDCVCSKKYDGSIGFTCAQVECPEDFNPPDQNNTCVRQYSMKSCCSEREVCGEDLKNELATCEWDGNTYKEGEKFYPKDTCLHCICSKDFNDTLEGPWCKIINCGIELYHAQDVRDKCAPIYFESRDCCPIQWTCMEETDVIQETASVKSNNPDQKCKYGKHTLDIGDQIKGEDECVTCKCQIPPLVSCVRAANC